MDSVKKEIKMKIRQSVDLLYMQAVRLAYEGELEQAEQLLRKIDGNITYKGADEGLFKEITRITLVEILLAQGSTAEAHSLLGQIRMVNPTIAADFEGGGVLRHPGRGSSFNQCVASTG